LRARPCCAGRSTIENVGRAGDFREDRGDQTVRAGFRRRELEIPVSTVLKQRGPRLHVRRNWDPRLRWKFDVRHCEATIPSPGAVKPEALTGRRFHTDPIRSVPIPAISATRARISPLCGPFFGRSQTIVTSS
jgi:hypothetical protein